MAATQTRVFALVLNPNAGRLLAGGGHEHALRSHLQAGGATVCDMPPGKLPDRVAHAAAIAADAVLVAGGDGTVACACQTLAGKDIALGIVPLGTMNLLARDLGMPVDDIAAAADILAAGHTRRIDAGRLGAHIFACACMLGAPARIGHHREIARARGNGPTAWAGLARAAMRALLKHRPMHLTVTIDGTQTRLRTRALTITVNALDDASGRAFGRTVLDGGELCAYAERVRTVWDGLRLATRIAMGSARDPALQHQSGRVIEVNSRRAALRLLIDGEEHLMAPPLRFEIWPGALTVLAPAGP